MLGISPGSIKLNFDEHRQQEHPNEGEFINFHRNAIVVNLDLTM